MYTGTCVDESCDSWGSGNFCCRMFLPEFDTRVTHRVLEESAEMHIITVEAVRGHRDCSEAMLCMGLCVNL